jgi:hypothetical protein
LKDLKVNHKAKMKLWCDSKSAISITNNPMQHDRTKHVEIDRFFTKKKLKNGLLELIGITNNPMQHDRTKHVEIDRFFIKKKLKNGLLELSHVVTRNQVANCLTKDLD